VEQSYTRTSEGFQRAQSMKLLSFL
jgi:hypothetical protein